MTTQWLDRNEYPFASRYFSVDGHDLHYIDEGQGQVILFVHGTPSWSFDFRNVIKALCARGYRCIAVDHIGFGLSDKPEHYDYSTKKHSHTLLRFIEHMKLKKFTMAVHDFGGVIGLNAAISNPGLIDKVVVLNSWLWSSKGDPDFERFSKILRSPLLPFLYRYLNFSPKFVMPASFGDHKLSGKLKKQYSKPFAGSSERNGPLAFAKSLLNDQDWFEELWNKKSAIANIPALFIWGMKDPVIKPHYLDKFVTGFPNSQVCKLDSCGHFPQEEQPGEVAARILQFIGG